MPPFLSTPNTLYCVYRGNYSCSSRSQTDSLSLAQACHVPQEGPQPCRSHESWEKGHVPRARDTSALLCTATRSTTSYVNMQGKSLWAHTKIITCEHFSPPIKQIHSFPCLFNSTIHTARAVLLQTKLQAATIISCCTPSKCAQPG